MPHSNPASNPIHTFLASTRLAPRQAHKALTLWPLLWRGDAEPGGPACVPLRTALEAGDVSVDELDESGAVPQVRVSNRGKQPVVFLFGEEIVGAKQNRVANATFLVPPVSTVVIDVSCVEAGRWERSGARGFHAAKEVVSNAMRRKMAAKVQRARAAGRSFDADQGEVWEEVGARLMDSAIPSSTSAWSDYRESRESDLAEMERTFQPLAGQVGFVAMQGESVVGLEALGRPDVFRASFQTLLRSYTIDAVDAAMVKRREGAGAGQAGFDAPEPFLEALANANVTWGTTHGIGSDLRIASPRVAGCALACEGLVHLTAFPAEVAA
jgi:hypothetical protein